VSDPSIEAVIATCRQLERPDNVENASSIAARLGYSERHLRRRFLETIGVTLSSYERAQKAERVRENLRGGSPVMEAVIDAGYGSTRAFYEHGAARLGMAPGRYRDGAKGERIRYTAIETDLGVVTVAATDQGVCSVKLGPGAVDLIKGLKAEFPLATIVRDDEGLSEVAAVLEGATKGEKNATQLPLDLTGTAFQIRVWDNSVRRDAHVLRRGGTDRQAEGGPSGCLRLRGQRSRAGYSLSPRHTTRWFAGRLPLGSRREGGAPRSGTVAVTPCYWQ
jgi:AraC family transcriptional regulator of adaptative response/methylated-DNA-[protein]-cysteine methyltransferase